MADLADCGQDSATIGDASQLAPCIAGKIRDHLACPWGCLVLQLTDEPAIVVTWGLDDQQQQYFHNRNGHHPPPDGLEFPLEYQQTPVGRLLLGRDDHTEALLTSGLGGALRRQIELLITIHQRESTHRSERDRLGAASLLSLDLVGQLDLREALQSLVERAAAICEAHAALIYMLAEDGTLVLTANHHFDLAQVGLRLNPGEGLAGRVVTERVTIVVDDYRAYPHRLSDYESTEWTSGIGVPLLVQQNLIGVLLVARRSVGAPFTTDDRHLIEAFAKPAALVLRNAQLFAQQHQRGRELYVLYENGKVINSHPKIEQVLTRVAENIALAMAADRCVVHLIEQHDSTMLYEAAAYSADGNDSSTGIRYAIATYSAISGLLRSGEALILDPAHHERRKAANEVLRFFGYRSAMLIPLKARSATVGLIAIGYVDQTHYFNQSEVNLAQTLASQMATAIINARLYEDEQRRARDLAKLHTINERLSADLSLDETLEALLDGVGTLVPFAGAQICLYDEENQVLWVALVRGLNAEQLAPALCYLLSDGLTGWIARYRRTLRLPNFQRPPVRPTITTLADGSPARSYLGLPLQIGNHLAGAIELYGDRPNAFSQTDEQLLVIVAGTAARAIANAQRQEQTSAHLRSRVQQLTALQRISRQLTGTLSLDRILSFALNEALRATPADQGYIALREGAKDDLEVENAETGKLVGYIALHEVNEERPFQVIAAAGYDGDDKNALMGVRLGNGGFAALEALSCGEPIPFDELAVDDRLDGIGPVVASALAMPIFYEDQIVGVVNLHSQTPRAFNHDTLEFVRAFADQIALALGNAQRYQEQVRQRELLQQRASMLNEVLSIGQVMRADRSLEEVLEQIAFSIIEVTRYRTVLFNLVDPDDSEMLRVVTGAGVPLADLERLRSVKWPILLAQRFLDKRFRVGRSFFVPTMAMQDITSGIDLSEFSVTNVVGEHAPNEWQIDDALFIPLYSTRAQFLGLLSVDDPYDRQRPTRRALEPLEIFADQAAIAIENTSLLREERIQAEQMTALYRVGAAVATTLDLDDLLEKVFHEICEYMGVPSYTMIFSYGKERDMMRIEMIKRERESLPKFSKTELPKSGLTGWVLDTDQLLLVNDVVTQGDYLPAQPRFLEDTSPRSWLGVPLRSQNEVIGVVSVQSFTPYAFSPRDVQFLTALANQLAVALENTRLFQERGRQIAELNAINQIGGITSSTLDLPKMLVQIYDSLHDFLQMDAGHIFVYNTEQNDVNLLLEVDGDLRELQRLRRGPLPKSLTERIITTRQPLLFRNLSEENTDSTLTPSNYGYTDRQSASWLGVLLPGGDGEVIGVMSVQSYTPNMYDERDLAFLTTVANQVTLGIQNALLFLQAQEQVQQLGLLNRISSVAATTLDSSAIYQAAIDALVRATGADQAWFMLFDRENNVANIVEQSHPTKESRSCAISLMNNPWVTWIDEQKRPLTSFDAQDDDLFVYAKETFQTFNVQSVAMIPLVIGDTVMGAIELDIVDRQRLFSAKDIELCQTIANQAATAMEKARLFAETQRKVEDLSTLLEAAQVLSSSLKPREVLDMLMEVVGRKLNVDTVALWTIDSSNVLSPAAMLGIPDTVARTLRPPVGQGLTGQVAASGLPLVVADVEGNGGSLYPTFQQSNQLTSFMGVPVIYRENTVGVLSVMTTQRRQFSSDEVKLLAGMADQAAIALENARLFEDRERRIVELTTLNQITSAITATLDLQDLLQRLHAELGHVVDVSTSGICLFDYEQQLMTYPIAYDQGEPIHIDPIPFDRMGIVKWVLTHRQPLLLGTNDEANQYRGHETLKTRIGPPDQLEQSYLVAPIISGDVVLGVINVQSYQPYAFNQDDVRFVSTAANQAAIAINNARVFQERGRRIEELATFNEIGQELSVLSRLDELVELIYRQTSRLLDTTNFYMALYDERRSEITFPLYYKHGERIDLQPMSAENNLTTLVIQARSPLSLNYEEIKARLASMSNPNVAEAPKSWLGVPMIASDHVIGVIAIRNFERDNTYSHDDVRLLSTIASWGAVALENARLLNETRQSFRELEELYATSVALSGTLDPSEVVDTVASNALNILQAQVCAVILFDDHQQPILHQLIDVDRPEVTFGPLDSSIEEMIQRLVEQDRTIAITDLAAVLPADALAIQAGLRGSINALIGSHEKPQGVILVATREPRDWQDREVSLLSILATQANQSLENAHLFDEVRRFAAELEQRVEQRTAELERLNTQLSEEKERLQTVHDVTLELTESLDLTKTLTKTLQLASQAVNVRRGSIMLRDVQTGTLICRAVLSGDGVVEPTRIPINFNTGVGLAGWVMKQLQPIRSGDVTKDSRWLYEEGRADEVRSVVAVPLVAQDAPLGVLMLTSPQLDYFSEAQLQLLTTIANEIAVVICNAELYGVINDIAQEKTELLIREKEEASKNKAILQSLGEGVIVLDEQQQVILFNPAAEQMLGIPWSHVLNQSLEQICAYGETEDARKRAIAIYTGLMEGLDTLSDQDQNHNRRLELPAPAQSLELNFAPVIGPDQRLYGSVVVLRDVTREIEADRAKRDFISTVSHELRTPLTSIKGYVDLLLLGAAGPIEEGQLSFLSVVKNNANRLMDLINDILEIGRIDSNKIELNFEKVNIAHILQDVMQTMRAEIERKSLTVRMEIRGEVPLIIADQRRITQVVMNLVSNAVKYTYSNGYIYVQAYLNPAGMLEIDVEDNGVGISEEDQKNLFRRFYRTDNPLRDEAGGTGLGLSIAKSFVELHGGEMWVRSEQGQGSSFSFILPVTQPDQSNAASEA